MAPLRLEENLLARVRDTNTRDYRSSGSGFLPVIRRADRPHVM